MGESYSGIRALADFIRDVTKYQHWRDSIAHRLQVGLLEMGLHKSQGILDRVLGDPLDEALQPSPCRL